MDWLDELERNYGNPQSRYVARCCPDIRKLIAAVRLAEKALDRVHHSGIHLAAIGIAEKVLFRIRSGDVEDK